MMMMMLMMIAASSINFAEAFKEEGGMGGVIHVGGKVLCQDCSQGWNEWVHGAKPIMGCKVSITCMDERKRVTYYGSDETDEAGDYEMTLNKYINGGKELDPNKCSVRLASSPDPVCNIATDFAGGRSGVKLRRATVVYRVKHVLSPFYYTTPMCDEPDTTTTTHSSSSSYAKQTKY
ncbi:pistil-specific extensin-like protein [Camellia sinensis]|uniref:pistil-specific extensin-like protein n=1 Tax=Camellia sinensis TaxID=4442 RepID=UPI001036073D|nr:pistil-specific extensin-like protein [Camellia sinensis]